ncbi:MAG TPA: M55 family metallopeptidase [Candidatus Acidoferrales bacterium]|jgi:D-amino peptidase|nr:M55 family metallopeptidase [Candidatus Acidoferrales bacterium]
MRLLLCLVLMCGPAALAQKRTVFVITDAEGVGGVCRQDQADPKDQEMRQLLTGEANAAVEGFLAGGAEEIVVWDGHDGSQTLSTLTIHPKAKLLMGALGPSMLMDRHFSAVAYVGQHSKANVRGGIMAHSYSSLGIQNMLLNGKPVGEIDVIAAMAGHFGTPVIMLSGDQAAASELHEIVPDAELAVVKEGIGRYTCISLSAPAARDAIREAARRSMSKIGAIKPYTVSDPVTLQVEYTTRNSLPIDSQMRLGAEVLDDRTIRFRGKNILEAWTLYRSR